MTTYKQSQKGIRRPMMQQKRVLLKWWNGEKNWHFNKTETSSIIDMITTTHKIRQKLFYSRKSNTALKHKECQDFIDKLQEIF